MRLTLHSVASEEEKGSTAADPPVTGERMAVVPREPAYTIRSPLARIIFALVCVPMALVAGILLVPNEAELFQDLRLLFLFLSIVACSAYGGILSGLLGTTLAYLGAVCFRNHWGLSHGLTPADAALLAAEGLAVNLIGWALDVARAALAAGMRTSANCRGRSWKLATKNASASGMTCMTASVSS